MRCCGPSQVVDGVAAGGGASLDLPAGTIWTFLDAGDPDGVIVTTDATPAFRTVVTLGAAGAALGYEGFVWGARDDGTEGAIVWRLGGFARNAAGSNLLAPVFFGPSGYVDPPPAVPWTTPGLPAGWGIAADFQVGDTMQVVVVGVAGVTIQWRALLFRAGFWGAVL